MKRENIEQLDVEGELIRGAMEPVIQNRYINIICSPGIKKSDPFYNRMLMELTGFSARNEINMIPLTLNTLDNGNKDSTVLMIGKFEENDLENIKRAFPRVISFENYPDHDDFVQIYFDHFKIGTNAVKLLSDMGHKKIIHITGPDVYASALYRKNGFTKEAQKAGIEFRVLEGKMNFKGGYSLAEQVAELVKTENFTAVFAANDWMAIGLIQALKKNKIDVPDKVSVLGVDNISLACQMAPALTTYWLDSGKMIKECFSLLDAAEVRSEEKNFCKRIILPPVLITRDTVKEP